MTVKDMRYYSPLLLLIGHTAEWAAIQLVQPTTFTTVDRML